MIPTLKRLQQSDVPEAPSWFMTVLGTVNKFMQDTYNILKGQVSFQENIRCSIKEIALTAPVSDFFVPVSLSPVTGVLLLEIDGASFSTPPVLRWAHAQKGILINSISGLSAGSLYNVRILII